MNGDENAKTTLGHGGAEEVARLRKGQPAREDVTPAECDHGPELARIPAASDQNEGGEAVGGPSGGGFERNGADSPPIQLSSDSEGFPIKADASRATEPSPNRRSAAFDLRAAELSVARRLEADSMLGVPSLDSLDWNLGDEDEAPSGLGDVMTGPSVRPGPPVNPELGDSLSSTLSFFGSDSRGDPDEESANAETQLLAGDSSSAVQYALPEVEFLSEGDPLDEEEPEPEGGVETQEPDSAVESPAQEIRTESAEEPTIRAESFNRVVIPPASIVRQRRPITPSAHRSARLLPEPSVSRLIEPATVGTVKPRIEVTPVVSARFSANTPIISSPVTAARRPTPGGTPYLRRPPAQNGPAGVALSRVILAGFITIGLIAAVLTYFH